MRAYRRVEDRYELKIDSGRIALLGVGAALVLVLVFLVGVLVGKGVWGAKRAVSIPPDLASAAGPSEALSEAQRTEARPNLTFYEDLKKPDSRGPEAAGAQSSRGPEQGQTRRVDAAASAAAAASAGPSRPAPAAREAATSPTANPPPEQTEKPGASKLPAAMFTIQVGSFRDRSAADDLARQVFAHDPSAQVISTTVAGHTWYRVQVGQFDTRGAAEAHYRSRLKPKGVQGFVTNR